MQLQCVGVGKIAQIAAHNNAAAKTLDLQGQPGACMMTACMTQPNVLSQQKFLWILTDAPHMTVIPQKTPVYYQDQQLT